MIHTSQGFLACLIILAGIFGVLSVPPSIAGVALQPHQTSSTSTMCTVSAESSLSIHVVASGAPVPGARVLLNGTYFCNGVAYASVLSGTTDSQGNAVFLVVPGAYYLVDVIPPPSLAGAGIVSMPITAPLPGAFATTRVSLTMQSAPSGGSLNQAFVVASLGATVALTGLLVLMGWGCCLGGETERLGSVG
jgi:hypothetical protein